MYQEFHALDLAGAIYEAALKSEGWVDALQTLSAALSADKAAIGCVDKCRHRFTLAANNQGELQAVADHAEKKPMTLDHRLLAGFKRPAGAVFWRVARRCPDVRIPTHLSNLFNGEADDHFLGLVIEDDWRGFSGVYATRPSEAAPFGGKEMALFAHLGDHFARALEMHAFAKHSQRDRDMTLLVLDHLAMGVVIVDADGRILQCNGEAQAILAANDGLLANTEGLCTPSAQETNDLSQAIRAAALTPHHAVAEQETVMVVHRPSMRRALELLVAPLADDQDGATLQRQGAIVFVSDPERQPRMATDALIRLYGLSRTEAELASELASGKTLAQFASETERNIETARKTLKRIFAKTDTGRQAELVGRLLTGPAALQNGA